MDLKLLSIHGKKIEWIFFSQQTEVPENGK